MTQKLQFNPFIVGAPIQNPADFVGREEIIRDILGDMLALQNISLRGERRTGKTSLLLHLAHLSSTPITNFPLNHIPVYFNFQTVSESNLSRIWIEIANTIARQIEQRLPNGEEESKKFIAYIEKYFANSTIPDASLGVIFGEGLSLLSSSGIKVHLLFDEFDYTARSQYLGEPFYNALRGLPIVAGNVSYVIATREGLAKLQPVDSANQRVSSPLYNIFRTITLQPFQEDDFYHLIFDYCDKAGLDLTIAEKLCNESNFFYYFTGYHPFFLQLLCYHLLTTLDEPNWPEGIAKKRAIRLFEEDAQPHFEYYWNYSSDLERKLLTRLATNPLMNSDLSVSETQEAIEPLRSRCLVLQTENLEQKWKLFSGSFGTWISSSVSIVEHKYREQVIKHYNKLALTGLPERDLGLHEIMMEQVFIKLKLELPLPADHLGADGKYYLSDDLLKTASKSKYERQEIEIVRRPKSVTLTVAEVLQQYKRLVILGGPGSGKTALMRWLAVIFARREQPKPENLGIELADDRLPIVLELRRFAERFVYLSQLPAVPDLVTEIANFISQHAYYAGTPVAFIQQALAEGRCLLLLDGLDEISDPKLRQLLIDSIQAFLQHRTQGYRHNLLLVTSRPHGYHSISLSAFQKCEVSPFTKDDVANFVRHWYTTAYPDQEQSEAADLTAAIQANERVGELATNPLLCTIIAIVYRNNRVLPNRRVELYLKCCEALLDTWERNKAIKASGLIAGYDWQTKLELLAPVAYWLHSEAERLAAPEQDFVKQLAQVLIDKKLGDSAKADQEARQFIALIRDRSGLLQGRGDGTLEFTHRTFQEYLAARHIAAQPYPDYIDWTLVHLHEAWWREVHLLVIGYLGSSSATADHTTALLQAILAYIPAPWPWLRSFSLTAMAPRWLLRLAARTKDANSLIVWMVKTMRMLVLSPYLVCSGVAWLWPHWQLAQRLAWLLNREWVLVAQGYLDCTPTGVRPTLTEQLTQHAEQTLTRRLYDRAYDDDLSEKYSQLIRAFYLSVSGLPLSIIAMRSALQDPDLSVQAGTHVLGKLGPADPTVITTLLTALQDPDSPVRYAAARALGQLGPADANVVSALLTALQDPDSSVRYAAARALGQLGPADPIITTLLVTLHDPDSEVQDAAIYALGQLKVEQQHLLYQVLVALNRRMHLPDDDKRQDAMNVIDKQLDGRPLPGYRWIPLRTRLERQRRINQFGWWAWWVCGLVLAALVVVYLSAQLDANSLLVRFGAAVALITGLAAGVAQVLGWTLRNPYGKHEP